MPNEIETIAILDSVRFIHLPPDRRTEICDALKTAMQALREQAERSKGCDYCGLIYKLDGASYGTDSVIIENRFCPICGRDVEGEP